MKIEKTSRTVTRHRVRLDRKAILDLLNDAGITLMADATVTFMVPGGGDWSNTSVDIDERHPVIVEWMETSEEGERD